MSNIAFSKIIAGTMNWGVWDKNYNTNQMVEMINCCLENNITSFDHADIYGDYSTEMDFGKAYKQSGITREKIQIISKCGILLVSEKRTNTVKHYNYTKEYITWSVEQSLKNLHTDYIDLLLLHRPSPLMQPDEIAAAVDQLKSEGKILSFGVSNFTTSQIDLIESKTKIEFNQIAFSVTNNEAMLNGLLDYMQLKNIIPMSWSPLGDVFKKTNEQTDRIKQTVELLASKYAFSAEAILLAWILKHPSKIFPVIGTTNPYRISNMTKAVDIDLDIEDWFILWSESMGNRVP
jgi:predicted oxidoreductase